MIELRHLASALGCLVLTKDCRKATNKVEQQPVLSTELSGMARYYDVCNPYVRCNEVIRPFQIYDADGPVMDACPPCRQFS